MHIRIDFQEAFTEIYIPLVYDSSTGLHQFEFPAFERQTKTGSVRELSPERFCELSYATSNLAPPPHSPTVEVPSDTIRLSALMEHTVSSLQVPLAVFYIQKYSASRQNNNKEAVRDWLYQYLSILEYQQLDSLLTVDANGFPSVINGSAISAVDQVTTSKWIQEVLIDHIFKLIGLIGRHGLQDEPPLIAMTHQYFSNRARYKQDALAAFIVGERRFKIESVFAADTISGQCTIPNILHETYWDADLLQPQGLEPVFCKTYPKEQVTVSIRPFDLDRDLEMVHRWFHRDHAKAIWQMNWDLPRLEQFYRSLLADKWGHAYIGEINGITTFNMEVYWATRDVVGNYFDVLPTDYGTHLFIAPTDKLKKFPSLTMQSIVSWLFEHPKVGRLVGEGAVESVAALMNKIHIGFKLQGTIEMPHKKAHLNFCYREWYWEKFPQNKPVTIEYELNGIYLRESALKKTKNEYRK